LTILYYHFDDIADIYLIISLNLSHKLLITLNKMYVLQSQF